MIQQWIPHNRFWRCGECGDKSRDERVQGNKNRNQNVPTSSSIWIPEKESAPEWEATNDFCFVWRLSFLRKTCIITRPTCYHIVTESGQLREEVNLLISLISLVEEGVTGELLKNRNLTWNRREINLMQFNCQSKIIYFGEWVKILVRMAQPNIQLKIIYVPCKYR